MPILGGSWGKLWLMPNRRDQREYELSLIHFMYEEFDDHKWELMFCIVLLGLNK